MNLSPAPDLPLVRWRGGCGMAEQVVQQLAQVEPRVDVIGEGAEMVPGVIAEFETLVATIDHRLQIGWNRVHPGGLVPWRARFRA